MNTEERAAAYLVIFLLEESMNKLGRRDTTLNSLVKVPGVRNIKDIEMVRVIRNHLVHTPTNYVEGYRLINKYKRSLINCLIRCSKYTHLYTESEIHGAVEVLFLFYKDNR